MTPNLRFLLGVFADTLAKYFCIITCKSGKYCSGKLSISRNNLIFISAVLIFIDYLLNGQIYHKEWQGRIWYRLSGLYDLLIKAYKITYLCSFLQTIISLYYRFSHVLIFSNILPNFIAIPKSPSTFSRPWMKAVCRSNLPAAMRIRCSSSMVKVASGASVFPAFTVPG